jgi:hypothetical protein
MSAGERSTPVADDSGDVYWAVSTFCAGNGSCVEVARHAGGEVWVRDGKNRDNGGILAFGRAGWRSFLDGVRAGEFGGR